MRRFSLQPPLRRLALPAEHPPVPPVASCPVLSPGLQGVCGCSFLSVADAQRHVRWHHRGSRHELVPDGVPSTSPSCGLAVCDGCTDVVPVADFAAHCAACQPYHIRAVSPPRGWCQPYRIRHSVAAPVAVSAVRRRCCSVEALQASRETLATVT